MKHLLITTIAAFLLIGCGQSKKPNFVESKPEKAFSEEYIEKFEDLNPKEKTDAATRILFYSIAEVSNPFAFWSSRDDQKKKYIDKYMNDIVDALSHGAIVNTNDYSKGSIGRPNGWSPLTYAITDTNMEIAKILIREGADVNYPNKDYITFEARETPLHIAACCGSKEIANLLIREGADVNAKDKDGKRPLDMAIGYKNPEVADLLRKHGGVTDAYPILAYKDISLIDSNVVNLENKIGNDYFFLNETGESMFSCKNPKYLTVGSYRLKSCWFNFAHNKELISIELKCDMGKFGDLLKAFKIKYGEPHQTIKDIENIKYQWSDTNNKTQLNADEGERTFVFENLAVKEIQLKYEANRPSDAANDL